MLHVFPAWPKEWDGTDSLLVRGAFLVSSSMRNGRVEFVDHSQQDAECRLRNPLVCAPTAHRDGRKAESLAGSILRLATRNEEKVVVVDASARQTM